MLSHTNRMICFFYSIRKAVSLINALDQAKFPLLLLRILQKLHLKVYMCDITIYPKYSVVSIQDDLGAFDCRYTSQSGCR